MTLAEGKPWREMRAFTQSRLRDFGYTPGAWGSLILEEVQDFLGLLAQKTENGPAQMTDWNSIFVVPTINPLWLMCTGKRLPLCDERVTKMVVDCRISFNQVTSGSTFLFGPKLRNIVR